MARNQLVPHASDRGPGYLGTNKPAGDSLADLVVLQPPRKKLNGPMVAPSAPSSSSLPKAQDVEKKKFHPGADMYAYRPHFLFRSDGTTDIH
eukprot:scaffold360789_cov28-Prasinocladus_malaysianus.AAC.1